MVLVAQALLRVRLSLRLRRTPLTRYAPNPTMEPPSRLMTLPSDNPTLDSFGRALSSLRVSVTDRCNLRCRYCMPLEDYAWLPGERLLSAEEIARLTEVFTAVGARRVRLTGGEPLLRRELPEIVRRLSANPAIEDLAMTTNGVLLADHAQALRDAGLGRVTVSLDTLRPDRFAVITRR